MKQSDIIDRTNQVTAQIYKPLPVVLAKGEGAWVWDTDGTRYLDCLAAYSAVNQGHAHPKIIDALSEQAAALSLTSRAFHNDKMGVFLEKLCALTDMDMAIPMNSGAEAVETAIKAMRLWGYKTKNIPENSAEILVASQNFHGRTTTIVSFSSEAEYKEHFGPLTGGFTTIPYGDAAALRSAIGPNTAGFLVEPIQGESGIVVPPDGYMADIREICTQHQILLAVDEIQTGLGRTGALLACDHDKTRPDLLMLGKALSGGVYPVSACLGTRDVMGLFKPGMHGSTYGGNPLASAVGMAALDVITDECLPTKAALQGARLMEALTTLNSPHIQEVRGKGLMIGVELNGPARPFCETLMAEHQILVKETHENVIRIAPPLVIDEGQMTLLIDGLRSILSKP